ncbi:MAG TPA: 4Fe-4S ferredoxin [Clostridiales bacterium UBA8153]|nr:4Fe-4S ferredoxin [Clostridiales bacterium UBA8153]
MKRAVVVIDEDKCNGCGACIPSCAEGALQIVDGKAKLIADRYCDGLGACLGECPEGAISIQEREADAFDQAAVATHLASSSRLHAPAHPGCPGQTTQVLTRPVGLHGQHPAGQLQSELAQWPIQLALVSPRAPYFDGANLLVAADCVPFAFPDLHRQYLRDRALVVACPKLDDTSHYAAKLVEIVKANRVRSVTVLHMEVPCCFGLAQIVNAATSGTGVTVRDVVIGIDGTVKEEHKRTA